MTISETESDRPADGISYALPDYTPRPHSNLGVGLNNYEPAWLLGHGFNMNDVNFSIFSAISDFGQRNFAQPPPPDHDQVYAAADALSVLNASPTLATARGRQEHQQQQNQPQQSASIVQHKWHTQLSSSLPVHMPSAPLSDPEQNLCIKLYSAQLSPVFPLIRAPSFRPSSESALLLLSICSVGALFVGSPSAMSQGRRIFQVLDKAVLSSWENYMGRDKRETSSLMQAALIGQTLACSPGARRTSAWWRHLPVL
ncbi:hypothetical protein DER44DRAFT_867604 [Fusarium oxysporum]|nr:hypothetical protein DER44DRAFT_867604 [Fusarium oxysporum]